jgi:XapX domain-containing protein
MRIILGFALAFIIGVVCRVARIPSPAPQALIGSLLVVTMSLGYITAEHWLLAHPHGSSFSGSIHQSRFMSRQESRFMSRQGGPSCK